MTATEPFAERRLDLCDAKFFDDPWETYRWLRHHAPLYRDEPNDLWVASKHEDVFHFSRDSETYCNRFGVRPKIAGDMSIITLDGQEHLRQRRLLSQGFTPRRVRELIPHIRELSNQIIDEIGEQEEIDFVEDFAIHVPLIVICELMGLDPETRMKMYRWSDDMMDGDGHVEPDDPVLLKAAQSFGEYAEVCERLIAERRDNPTDDDIIGVLTQAFDAGDLDKEFKAMQGVDEAHVAELELLQLEDDELLNFLTVLLVAGNETTRNAISGGLLALSLFPEQKKNMLDHLTDEAWMDRAVDEIIRYVSPVLGFIRTVTRSHTYKGVDFDEGDRILMLYQSANRDEDVFDDPDHLDLERDPNPHLAFGIGPHFCLGSNLARAEVKTVLEALLSRLPDISVKEGVPLVRGDSSLVLGLQHLPAEFTAESRCPAHRSG